MADNDDERLDRLKTSLSKARESQPAARAPQPEKSDASQGDSGMSLGMRAGSEFISAVIVGAGIGWALDRLLGDQSGVPDRVFLAGGRRRSVERHPRSLRPKAGVQGSIRACLIRMRRIKGCGARLRRRSPTPRPGAKPAAGPKSPPAGRTTTRIRRRGDGSGTGDQSDRAILHSSGRADLDCAR